MVRINNKNIRVENKLKILEISCRSDTGGGLEQLFKIAANLKNAFKFYSACPDQGSYYNKIIDECVPVFKLPHRNFEIKNLSAGHANFLLFSYY